MKRSWCCEVLDSETPSLRTYPWTKPDRSVAYSPIVIARRVRSRAKCSLTSALLRRGRSEISGTGAKAEPLT